MADPEAAAALVAGRQHGVISRAQALACGLTDRQIAIRVARGRWRRLRDGAFAITGHADDPLHRLAAALATSGPASVLAGWSAVWLWRLGARSPLPIDVVVPRGRNVMSTAHRLRLLPGDATEHRGLPVLTVPRLGLELAQRLPARRVGRLLDEGLRGGATSADSLGERASRADVGRRRGGAAFRRLVDERLAIGIGESPAEDLLLAALAAARLPAPVHPYPVGRYRVDAGYPAERIAIECDGRGPHTGAEVFDADRRRGNEIVLADHLLLRFAHRTLAERPTEVAAHVRAALVSRARPRA